MENLTVRITRIFPGEIEICERIGRKSANVGGEEIHHLWFPCQSLRVSHRPNYFKSEKEKTVFVAGSSTAGSRNRLQ